MTFSNGIVIQRTYLDQSEHSVLSILANESSGRLCWWQGILTDVQKVMNSQPKVDENLERFLAEYDEYKLQNTDSIDQSGLNPGEDKIKYQSYAL